MKGGGKGGTSSVGGGKSGGTSSKAPSYTPQGGSAGSAPVKMGRWVSAAGGGWQEREATLAHRQPPAAWREASGLRARGHAPCTCPHALPHTRRRLQQAYGMMLGMSGGGHHRLGHTSARQLEDKVAMRRPVAGLGRRTTPHRIFVFLPGSGSVDAKLDVPTTAIIGREGMAV